MKRRLFPTITPLRLLHHLGEFLYWMLRAKESDHVPSTRKLQALLSAIPLLLHLISGNFYWWPGSISWVGTPFCLPVEEYPISDKIVDVIFQLSHWPWLRNHHQSNLIHPPPPQVLLVVSQTHTLPSYRAWKLFRWG